MYKDIGSRLIRKINPLGMRVLVQIKASDDQTPSGLYVPENAKDNMSESLLAEVLEVASALDDETDEETNVSGIPQGAMVLIPKEIGTKIPWDENLRVVDTCDILAIIDEISLV